MMETPRKKRREVLLTWRDQRNYNSHVGVHRRTADGPVDRKARCGVASCRCQLLQEERLHSPKCGHWNQRAQRQQSRGDARADRIILRGNADEQAEKGSCRENGRHYFAKCARENPYLQSHSFTGRARLACMCTCIVHVHSGTRGSLSSMYIYSWKILVEVLLMVAASAFNINLQRLRASARWRHRRPSIGRDRNRPRSGSREYAATRASICGTRLLNRQQCVSIAMHCDADEQLGRNR